MYSSNIITMNAQNGIYRTLLAIFWVLWPLSVILAVCIALVLKGDMNLAKLAPIGIVCYVYDATFGKRAQWQFELTQNTNKIIIKWVSILSLPFAVSAVSMSYIGAPESLEWLWIAGVCVLAVVILHTARWIFNGFKQ